jgi:hypothetical protein
MLPTTLILFICFITALIVILLGRKIPVFTISPWLTGFFFILAILGAGLTSHYGQEISTAFARHKWPRATATVMETKVVGERASNPEIYCQYQVEGKEYVLITNLETPGFGRKRSRRETAEIINSEYPVGSVVKVFYNPNDPRKSFIRTGPFWSDYMKLALGILLLSFGFAAVMYQIVINWSHLRNR